MKLNRKETKNTDRTGVSASGTVVLATLAGVLLSAPFVADRIEKHALMAGSKGVSQALRALIKAHPDSPCATELEKVAWQMDAAAMQLERNNGWKALSFMDRAEQALIEVSRHRSSKQIMAPFVKPILTKLESVQNETELYERVIAMRQVSLF